jgi:hypothetical protein
VPDDLAAERESLEPRTGVGVDPIARLGHDG